VSIHVGRANVRRAKHRQANGVDDGRHNQRGQQMQDAGLGAASIITTVATMKAAKLSAQQNSASLYRRAWKSR